MFRVSSLNNSHPTTALFVPDKSARDLLDVEKLAKGTFILSTPDLTVLYIGPLFSPVLFDALQLPAISSSFPWQWDQSLTAYINSMLTSLTVRLLTDAYINSVHFLLATCSVSPASVPP